MKKVPADVASHSMSDDYFALFSLPQAYTIDLQDLDKKYFALQQDVHPDQNVGAMHRSMDVNDAYKTLKSPVKRATYLLSLVGINISEEKPDRVKPSQEILMHVLEVREALDNANTKEACVEIIRDMQEAFSKTEAKMSAAFAEEDFNMASQLAIELRYLEKIIDEGKEKKRGV